MTMLEIYGDKFYATSKAYIVEEPQDLPVEMASEFSMNRSNGSFIWVAGRYVQANNANKNGHFWTFEDLKQSEASIVHTPLNVAHEWEHPVGTVVQTKMVQREGAASGGTNPEIQALSVVWAAAFPQVATEVRDAHKQGTLFYSMECVAEQKQCLSCERTFAFAAAGADVCEHLGQNRLAPRRFINTTFVGAALIYPPERPAWKDADITDVASELTREYAQRDSESNQWEGLMAHVMANAERVS
jgi:hypothetical protein